MSIRQPESHKTISLSTGSCSVSNAQNNGSAPRGGFEAFMSQVSKEDEANFQRELHHREARVAQRVRHLRREEMLHQTEERGGAGGGGGGGVALPILTRNLSAQRLSSMNSASAPNAGVAGSNNNTKLGTLTRPTTILSVGNSNNNNGNRVGGNSRQQQQASPLSTRRTLSFQDASAAVGAQNDSVLLGQPFATDDVGRRKSTVSDEANNAGSAILNTSDNITANENDLSGQQDEQGGGGGGGGGADFEPSGAIVSECNTNTPTLIIGNERNTKKNAQVMRVAAEESTPTAVVSTSLSPQQNNAAAGGGGGGGGTLQSQSAMDTLMGLSTTSFTTLGGSTGNVVPKGYLEMFGLLVCQEALKEVRSRKKNISPFPADKYFPMIPAPLPKFKSRILLCIDIDETLLHSSLVAVSNDPSVRQSEQKKLEGFDACVQVESNSPLTSAFVCVNVRPHVQEFLQCVSDLFECAIFTASQSPYANLVMEIVDPQKRLLGPNRLYREHCAEVNGQRVKDLSLLGRRMDRVVLLDNSPVTYKFQPRNAIPITSYFEGKEDTALKKLIPVMHRLSTAASVFDVLDYYNAHLISPEPAEVSTMASPVCASPISYFSSSTNNYLNSVAGASSSFSVTHASNSNGSALSSPDRSLNLAQQQQQLGAKSHHEHGIYTPVGTGPRVTVTKVESSLSRSGGGGGGSPRFPSRQPTPSANDCSPSSSKLDAVDTAGGFIDVLNNAADDDSLVDSLNLTQRTVSLSSKMSYSRNASNLTPNTTPSQASCATSISGGFTTNVSDSSSNNANHNNNNMMSTPRVNANVPMSGSSSALVAGGGSRAMADVVTPIDSPRGGGALHATAVFKASSAASIDSSVVPVGDLIQHASLASPTGQRAESDAKSPSIETTVDDATPQRGTVRRIVGSRISEARSYSVGEPSTDGTATPTRTITTIL